jgi:hypothetical protein
MISCMSMRVRPLAVALIVLSTSARAAAQDTALAEILTRLIQADVRLARPPAGSGFISHDAHFIPGQEQELAPFFFNQSILSQLSTFPIGSSSGGFSYSFDPALGTFVRSTDTFGPVFAERAVTLGKNRVNVGASYQYASYSKFEGLDLESGDIRFYLTHEDIPGDNFFEGDVIETALRLNLSTSTIATFVSYGVTDRFDLGINIPVVHVRMEAAVDAKVLRLATGTIPIHQFPGGGTEQTFTEEGEAAGVSDILLRGKYQLTRVRGGGLAAALDVRFPSGDDRNLLGTGATQIKASLIGSAPLGKFAPHVNIGYTWSENASASESFQVSDEVHYAAGTELQASPRLTLVGGISGRTLRRAGRLWLSERTFNFVTGPAPGAPEDSAVFTEFALRPGNLNLSGASAGLRFNPTGNWLISANVLFPISDAGIKARPIPVIGVDYAF